MHYGKCGSGVMQKIVQEDDVYRGEWAMAGDRKRRPHTNFIAGDKKVVSESCNILKSERMSDVK